VSFAHTAYDDSPDYETNLCRMPQEELAEAYDVINNVVYLITIIFFIS